jgi:hypothetical protein
VPGRRDEIVDRVIAGIAQGPYQGFRLVEMAHSIVTPLHASRAANKTFGWLAGVVSFYNST